MKLFNKKNIARFVIGFWSLLFVTFMTIADWRIAVSIFIGVTFLASIMWAGNELM